MIRALGDRGTETRALQGRCVVVSSGFDRLAGSGAAFYISEQLAGIFQAVDEMIAPQPKPSILRRVGWRVRHVLTGETTRWKCLPAYADASARTLQRRLGAMSYDLLFGVLAGWDLARLQVSRPIINCTDSTLPRSLDLGHYALLEQLGPTQRQNAIELEGSLARRAHLNVVSTEWVAESLMRDYRVPRERIVVIPWGANLDPDEVPSGESVVRKSPGKVCKLLFIGSPWYRKGGDIAVDALKHLQRSGIPAELSVVGCQPPPGLEASGLRVVGRLSKEIPEERRELHRLFRESSFLVVPTRADTFGHVFCEAGAFGLPTMTAAVGGVPEVVRHGRNGFAMPKTSSPADYANLIAAVWREPERYRMLSLEARKAYEERLSWQCWGDTMRQVLAANMAPVEPAAPGMVGRSCD